MTKFDGIVELGALYLDGAPLPRPTRPWIVDLSMLEPYPGIEPGNIAEFEEAPEWSRWTLADTPADPASRLRWIALRTEGRRLLICDRVILVRVSWQDLDAAGLVGGVPIDLDGDTYTCRLPSGGSDFRTDDDGYSGGSPGDNEWDRFVVAEDAVAGLPMPSRSDLAGPLCEADRLGGHNCFWNWVGAVSWTMMPFARRASARCCRGYAAAGFFYLNTVDHRHEDIGWRPVLECPL